LGERERFFEFATALLKAEGNHWAGRTNLLGTVAVFLLVYVPGLIFDAIQIVVRIWNEDYETGWPSVLSVVRTFGFLLIACVLVLALAEVLQTRARRGDRQSRD
jgi:hypothetical protein